VLCASLRPVCKTDRTGLKLDSRAKSPYTLTYVEQVKLCLERGFWRLKADPTLTLSQLFGNSAMALIVSSVFYNLPSVSHQGSSDETFGAKSLGSCSLDYRTRAVSSLVDLSCSLPSCSMPLPVPSK
jgi:hypothetical protein